MNFAGIYVYVLFFIFTTVFLSKQTNRMFQQKCRQSLERPLELSPGWVKPLLPHLTLSSGSVYRCSAMSWGIPKTAVSMAMDLRQAEQWLLLWACDFPCWTQESNPGTPVWAPQCGSYLSRLPPGNAQGCRSVLPPQRPPHSHKGPMTFKILLWLFDMAAEGFRSTQNRTVHLSFTRGSGLLVQLNSS